MSNPAVAPAPSPSPSLAAATCAKACSGGNPYAKGGPRSHLIDFIISENGFQAREPAHALFGKIVRNILNNPNEEKFRKLNIEKVIGKFGSDFKGIAELLHHLGFIADGPNLILPMSAPLDPLCQSLCAWDERESKSAAARAEAERIRMENMKEIDAEKARKEAARAQVKCLGQQARAEVAVRPVNDSKGTAVKFGSTLMKAPPPPPAAKGG